MKRKLLKTVTVMTSLAMLCTVPVFADDTDEPLVQVGVGPGGSTEASSESEETTEVVEETESTEADINLEEIAEANDLSSGGGSSLADAVTLLTGEETAVDFDIIETTESTEGEAVEGEEGTEDGNAVDVSDEDLSLPSEEELIEQLTTYFKENYGVLVKVEADAGNYNTFDVYEYDKTKASLAAESTDEESEADEEDEDGITVEELNLEEETEDTESEEAAEAEGEEATEADEGVESEDGLDEEEIEIPEEFVPVTTSKARILNGTVYENYWAHQYDDEISNQFCEWVSYYLGEGYKIDGTVSVANMLPISITKGFTDFDTMDEIFEVAGFTKEYTADLSVESFLVEVNEEGEETTTEETADSEEDKEAEVDEGEDVEEEEVIEVIDPQPDGVFKTRYAFRDFANSLGSIIKENSDFKGTLNFSYEKEYVDEEVAETAEATEETEEEVNEVEAEEETTDEETSTDEEDASIGKDTKEASQRTEDAETGVIILTYTAQVII